MAFQKIDNGIGMPSLASLLGSFNQLRQQQLANQKSTYENQYTQATQPSNIERQLLTNSEFMKLLPEQAQLQIIQAQQAAKLAPLTTRSQIDVLPSMTGAQIATNKATEAKQGLEQQFPILGYSPAFGAIEYYENKQGQPQANAQGGGQQGIPLRNAGQQGQGNNPYSGTNLANLALQSVTAPIQEKLAIAEKDIKQANAIQWQGLPAQDKALETAQARAHGIDPGEYVKLRTEGLTKQDIYETKGTQQNPDLLPQYAPTNLQINQLQQGAQAEAELTVLSPKVTDGLAKYSSKVNGLSWEETADAIKGTNTDDQAKYLAARALTPELAAIRIRLAGGQVGIESIREVTEKTYGELKALQLFTSPEVFAQTQKYIDNWVTDAFNERKKVGLTPALQTNVNQSLIPSLGQPQQPNYTTQDVDAARAELARRRGGK